MPRHKLSSFEQEARHQIAINLKKYMHGMAQADLALKSGIPVTTISGYLREKSTPNAGNLEKLAAALHVSKSDIDIRYAANDIFEFIKNAPKGTYKAPRTTDVDYLYDQDKIVLQVPIIGTIACGEPILAEQNIDGYTDQAFMRQTSDGLFALRCKGKSMEPTIPDGSIVVIHQQPIVEDGEIAAVQMHSEGADTDEATLKRVKHVGGQWYVTIDGTLVKRGHDGTVGDYYKQKGAKTAAGNRVIFVPSPAMAIVRRHKQSRPFLFLNAWSGGPMVIENVNHVLLTTCRRAKIKKRVTSHFFRHTHVSKLAEQGVPLDVIERRVGHSGTKTIVDIYEHITRNTEQKLETALDHI